MSDVEFEDSTRSTASSYTNTNRPVFPPTFNGVQVPHASNRRGMAGKIMGWFGLQSEEAANKVLLIVAGLFFAASLFFFLT